MGAQNDTNSLPDFDLNIDRVDVVVRRYEIENPIKTSFGTMSNRPAVFVRVVDRHGVTGYGEVWCNFPACGAEHRARLFETEIAPRMRGRTFRTPANCFAQQSESTRILALQTGEIGPVAQCLAGLDVALWDLAATRIGEPLYRMLGGRSSRIGVYASGINPQGVAGTVDRARANGHSRFKLKIGFGDEIDFANVETVRSSLGPDERFMVDANQAWSFEAALANVQRLAEYGPDWIEEPMRVDSPQDDWIELKRASRIAIAGGENFADTDDFEAAIAGNWLDVIQPDVCKWGGISQCFPLAKQIVGAGRTYCPHSLGGGVALAASAHLLVAAGGDGLLEIDANPNPLREDIFPIEAESGEIQLADRPGLGIDREAIAPSFRIAARGTVRLFLARSSRHHHLESSPLDS